MDLFPAIDLREGKCVRLLQGDYRRQIDYSDDPVAQATEFARHGARWIHLVDLDGAREGVMQNRGVIEAIASEAGVKIEVGGGVRDEQTIAGLLEAGVTQVVVGTRALEDPDWFKTVVHDDRFAGRVVLGLDAREGRIATRGWTQTGEITTEDMAEKVNEWPLAAIVYTDIACDGMLTGPNVAATDKLARQCKVPVIASGGVGTLEDIRKLARLPVRGIIVGRALYEGQFDLAEALAALEPQC